MLHHYIFGKDGHHNFTGYLVKTVLFDYHTLHLQKLLNMLQKFNKIVYIYGLF